MGKNAVYVRSEIKRVSKQSNFPLQLSQQKKMKSSPIFARSLSALYCLGGEGDRRAAILAASYSGTQNLSNKLWFTWYMSFLLTWGTTS